MCVCVNVHRKNQNHTVGARDSGWFDRPARPVNNGSSPQACWVVERESGARRALWHCPRGCAYERRVDADNARVRGENGSRFDNVLFDAVLARPP